MPNSPRIRGLHTVSASLVLNSFDYNEDFPPPGKSSENGWLFGMGFHYTYKGGSQLPLYGKLRFDFSPSGTEYGSNEETGPGFRRDFTETSHNWFHRIEFDAGFVFHDAGGSFIDITPYTGFGYRFWRRELSDHNELLGYAEDYSWSYLPIGVIAEIPIASKWSIGLDVAWPHEGHGVSTAKPACSKCCICSRVLCVAGRYRACPIEDCVLIS